MSVFAFKGAALNWNFPRRRRKPRRLCPSRRDGRA